MAEPDATKKSARRRSVRRWIVRVVVFLLLGAVVNVAVAWGIAIFVDVEDPQDPQWLHPSAFWESGNKVMPYWCASFTSKIGAERVRYCVYANVPRRARELTNPQRQLPSWLALDKLPTELTRSMSFFLSADECNTEDARGWPALSLKCRFSDYAIYTRRKEVPQQSPNNPYYRFWENHEIKGDELVAIRGLEKGVVLRRLVPGDSVEDGVLLPVRSNPSRNALGWSPIVVLPMRPIWNGFILNSLFYTAILWLVFVAPFALRRWRRVRKGLCPKCAYPAGASDVCTECGAAIQRRNEPRP